MRIWQQTIFNNDIGVDISYFGCFNNLEENLQEIIRYPNLYEHYQYVDDFKSIMNCKIGDEFKFKDYIIKFIPFDETKRPADIKDNILYLMCRDDFSVHYYWNIIFITIYKFEHYGYVSELCSYSEVVETFKDYKYNSIVILVGDEKYKDILYHKQNIYDDDFYPTTFVDILYVLSLNNLERMVPDNPDSIIKYNKELGIIRRRSTNEDEMRMKENLIKQFYFRVI